MEKYIKALEGISYQEWCQLQMVISRQFAEKRKELEGELQLKMRLEDTEKIDVSNIGKENQEAKSPRLLICIITSILTTLIMLRCTGRL